jgi:glutamine synthetase
MREDGGWDAIIAGCEAIGRKVEEHVSNYGVGIEERLTGAHETAHYSKFSYGISNRGASVRIPGQVAREKRGYIEDRRPNANVDPYVVARLMVETVCGAAAKSGSVRKAPAARVGANKVAASKAVKSTTKRAVKSTARPVKKAARR